jgi:predicted nucleic acid-binding protein
MKIVFDTNVILDVLVEREPFVEVSAKAFDAIDRKDVSGAMTANTVTDLFFLYRKHQSDPVKRKEAIRGLVTALEVLDTTRALCLSALDSPISDFEDAVVAESAKLWSADFIVTRDTHGFDDSPVKAITPDELLKRFDA